MSEPLLSCQNLAIGYDGKAIGQDINLSLHSAEILALLGPNGSGKTTLFRTLLGLLKPIAGKVELFAKPLTSYPRKQLAQLLAYVPQAQVGAFAFSVEEMVLMGRYAYIGSFSQPNKTDKAIALACLEQLGIAHLAQQNFTQISGGQRQLVLIARALAQQAKVLVLDEPTASLDFANQILVLDCISQLRQQGMGILLCTHQPEHALLTADRVALYKEGQIEKLGMVEQTVTVSNLAVLYGLPEQQLTAHFNLQIKA